MSAMLQIHQESWKDDFCSQDKIFLIEQSTFAVKTFLAAGRKILKGEKNLFFLLGLTHL